jgi:hypothetical protein
MPWRTNPLTPSWRSPPVKIAQNPCFPPLNAGLLLPSRLS